MRTLITVILVLVSIFHLNTKGTENGKVLERGDLLKIETKRYETYKKEKTFLKKTERIVDNIVNNVKNISNTNKSHKTISHKRELRDAGEIETEIREVLAEQGVKPFTIELIVAQSKHESGNYKNGLTEYNNIFARHYFKADTFATSAGAPGEGHTRFAKYPSVKSATLSQLWYFKRKRYSMDWSSTYQFAAECKRKGYYEAPLSVYVNALNKYMP